MEKLINQNIPITTKEISYQEATQLLEKLNLQDTRKQLQFICEPSIKINTLNDFSDIWDDIDEKSFYKYMYNELPPIDLMIRTSGELRISNFLMYELSYAELYFTETCFPDFNEEAFEKAVEDFNTRERRFGGNKK